MEEGNISIFTTMMMTKKKYSNCTKNYYYFTSNGKIRNNLLFTGTKRYGISNRKFNRKVFCVAYLLTAIKTFLHFYSSSFHPRRIIDSAYLSIWESPLLDLPPVPFPKPMAPLDLW